MPAPTSIELIYLIAIAHVWARGSIFRWLRNGWAELLDCPLCSGWWIGVLGHMAFQTHPVFMSMLGIGSIVGTSTLALCGVIRRL